MIAAGRIDLAADDRLAARLRSAPGPVVTAVIPAPHEATAAALVRATVAAVAMERAPLVRVNAVLVADGAAPVAVDRVAAFLTGAVATTGQTLDVAGDRLG
jgi:hypothetical protein